MRKIKNIVYWLIALGYVIVAIFLISAARNDTLCSDVTIEISENTDNYFVNEQDILDLIQDKEIRLLNQPIESINLDELENLIIAHPSIKDARVYCNVSGKLIIEVIQRKPIIRIMNRFSGGYYLDEEASAMPLSDKYTAHVLLASGNINESYNIISERQISQTGNPDGGTESYLLDDIFKLASFIKEDEFWNAQIEQIYINKREKFELIPRVGNHLIILGSAENFKEKLAKMKLLYEQGFNKVGWNTYKTINLEYKNQIVCTKK